MHTDGVQHILNPWMFQLNHLTTMTQSIKHKASHYRWGANQAQMFVRRDVLYWLEIYVDVSQALILPLEGTLHRGSYPPKHVQK